MISMLMFGPWAEDYINPLWPSDTIWEHLMDYHSYRKIWVNMESNFIVEENYSNKDIVTSSGSFTASSQLSTLYK